MSSRNFDFSIGEYYHVYNRGTDKRIIFLDVYDKQRFVKLLYLCNSEKYVNFRGIADEGVFHIQRGDTIIDIGAYCLMQNHFHLLLHEKVEGGISLFMLKLLTAYSTYFNGKYERTGSLFEGKFKAVHADYDEYLKYLFSYIHLNPVKLIDSKWKENGIADRAGAKKHLDSYNLSSYVDYMGTKREENAVLNIAAFPKYFENTHDFKQCLNEWLTFKDVI